MKFPAAAERREITATVHSNAIKADSSVGPFSLIEIAYITVIPSVLQESNPLCVCVCENSSELKVAGAK